MTKTWKTGITSAILSISLLGAGAALTPAAHAQTANPMPESSAARGEWGSNHSIAHVRQRLERVIDNLQRDQHDYGGHRVKALELCQQARAELLQAEQYEKAHPGQ